MSVQGLGFERLSLVVHALRNGQDRHLRLDICQYDMYIKECGLAPRCRVILFIIINLILSSISIRPGVALSFKNLLIQRSLLDPTTNL